MTNNTQERNIFIQNYSTRFPLRAIQEQGGAFYGETQEHYETWQAARATSVPDGDVVERVARAICESRTWPGAWSSANEVEKRLYTEDATAAIAALPAPSAGKIDREVIAKEIVRYFAGYSYSKHEFTQCLGCVDVLIAAGVIRGE